MQIDSNTLINKSILDTKKFDKNIDTKRLEEEQLRKVSNDFEAFFLNQIMEISLKNVDIAGSATGSDIIKSMYTQALSDKSAGSFGISDMIYKFISENQNKEIK